MPGPSRAAAPGAPPSTGSPFDGARTLERGLAVLESICRGGARGLTLAEVSKATLLHKSTAYRLIETLRRQGYVRQDPHTERYQVGFKLLALASGSLNEFDLRGAAAPLLQALARQVGQTAHLAILEGDYVVYLEKVSAGHWNQPLTNVGMRSPAHCTASGKVMLAYSPPDVIERVLSGSLPEFTPYTITDSDVLREQLRAIREQGFATADREMMLADRSLAAPVFDHHGAILAAVAVAGPVGELTLEDLRMMAPLVMSTAQGLSRLAGQRSP